jgi:hypothetical protein
MKTAISIPDPVFRSAESLARRLGVSRSQLYANAVADFVARHRQSKVTEKLNAVYGKTPAGVDPETMALQLKSIPPEDW